MLNNSKTRSAKQIASKAYTEANKEVKSNARKDKWVFVDKLTEEAEEAARQNNIKALYDNIKLLTRKYQKGSRPVKNIEGKTLNTKEEQMSRWVEHFKNVLNQEAPVNKADILPAEETLSVDCKRPSKEEIKKAIKTEKQQGTWYRQYTCRSTQSRHRNIGTNPICTVWKDLGSRGSSSRVERRAHSETSEKRKFKHLWQLQRHYVAISALNRVMLQRLKIAVDDKLRDNQAGFRQNRSCTDQIATLRIILKQSHEFNSSLYTVFVDFTKAL